MYLLSLYMAPVLTLGCAWPPQNPEVFDGGKKDKGGADERVLFPKKANKLVST